MVEEGRFIEKKQESPICSICKYKVIKLMSYNGQKMCQNCKQCINKGRVTRSFEGERK